MVFIGVGCGRCAAGIEAATRITIAAMWALLTTRYCSAAVHWVGWGRGNIPAFQAAYWFLIALKVSGR